MPRWEKPVAPPATLTAVNSEGLQENTSEMDNGRTRPPLQNYGTWGDTVYPGMHHTDDPKAPKVTKSL